MVALAIGALLTLGLLQIFAASSGTAQMQEGLSRVQENGRFAMQYLQRHLSMVGFMGCGSDGGRMEQASFVNHLAEYDVNVPGGNSVPAGTQYRFQRPLEAFTAGSAPAPTELAGIEADLVPGSDVLILRVLSEESVPVIRINRDVMTLSVDLAATPDFLPDAGNQALFAMQNCRSADVFAGTLAGARLIVDGSAAPNAYMDPTVTSCGGAGCPWDSRISNATLNARPLTGGPPRLNAEVHRAEYMALYVKERADGVPGLYMSRFGRNNMVLDDPIELVEGVENVQLRFGYDVSVPMDGTVDEYRTAEDVAAGATDAPTLDQSWRRVLNVRVATLIRSASRAAVNNEERTFRLLGVDLTRPADGTMRQVYETTVALRNRLFNS